MQEPFEKNIEQQLKSFTLQPNETVWQEVEQALHSKKKRFLPFWFFGIIGLFMLGIATKLFYTANTTLSIFVKTFSPPASTGKAVTTVLLGIFTMNAMLSIITKESFAPLSSAF